VNDLIKKLTPKSLAGRLVALILVALALAQLALTLILKSREDSIVQEIVDRQALIQTVPIVRLLQNAPPENTAAIVTAFHSQSTCVHLQSNPPADHVMNDIEQEFADRLAQMLDGVLQGAPQVLITRLEDQNVSCDGKIAAGSSEDKSDGDKPHIRTLGVEMNVPYSDQHWLAVETAVEIPDPQNRSIALLFLISSLVVGAVAFVAVRTQTKSLRRLADASERFGRGEAVQPLPESGPSEVVAATHAFNTMQERLSSFLKDRLRLLASVSHDLRTPLTSLRLKAELLDDETARDSLVVTIEELIVICEATLAFTRAEAGGEATAEVDLGRLVRDACDEFTAQGEVLDTAQLKSIPYCCRPVALKRAVRNLVQNALRYGGNARVSTEKRLDNVIICIDDDGPGIDLTKMEDVFQPFVRLEESRNSETGGVGLGLAITRSIIKAHGGSVILSNRREGGLRAEIQLPAK
jgi:signal transduction histidine kinase